MKRTSLLRRSPLRPGKPMKRWVRREETKVTPELREYVLRRDGRCLASRVDLYHMCRDQWGNRHPATDIFRLTLDHVKREARMGLRAESSARTLVATCWAANVLGWCSSHRLEERTYLAMVEPDD